MYNQSGGRQEQKSTSGSGSSFFKPLDASAGDSLSYLKLGENVPFLPRGRARRGDQMPPLLIFAAAGPIRRTTRPARGFEAGHLHSGSRPAAMWDQEGTEALAINGGAERAQGGTVTPAVGRPTRDRFLRYTAEIGRRTAQPPAVEILSKSAAPQSAPPDTLAPAHRTRAEAVELNAAPRRGTRLRRLLSVGNVIEAGQEIAALRRRIS